MEIKFVNVLFDKVLINLSISNNSILGTVLCDVCNIFTKKIKNGEISIDGLKINKDTEIKKLTKFKSKIYFCSNNLNELHSLNIMDDINDKVKTVNGNRLYELFKIFGLDKSIIDRSYYELSTSEKKKALLICAIMSKKKTIVMENPSYYLDDKSQDNLIIELKRLKRDKIIIIDTDDTEFLLKVADRIALFNNNNFVVGNKYEILSNEELMSSLSLKVPDILKLSNKANELKSVRLGYRDNLNDIVKDIYRHAR